VISQVEVEVSYGVDDSVLSSDFENILDSSATSNAQEPLVVALSPVKENQLSNYPTWIENYEVEDCMQLSSCYNTQESEVDDCNNMPQKLSVETLNTVPYMREVRRIIANYMDQGKDLRCENITNFQLKFDRVGGITYKRADPSFDAWMCVRGKKRNVFQPELLVQRYPSLIETTKDIRKICNVRPSTSTNDIVHVKPPPEKRVRICEVSEEEVKAMKLSKTPCTTTTITTPVFQSCPVAPAANNTSFCSKENSTVSLCPLSTPEFERLITSPGSSIHFNFELQVSPAIGNNLLIETCETALFVDPPKVQRFLKSNLFQDNGEDGEPLQFVIKRRMNWNIVY